MVFAFLDIPALDELDVNSVLSELTPDFGHAEHFGGLDWLSPPDTPTDSSFDPMSQPPSPAMLNSKSFWGGEDLFSHMDADSERSMSPSLDKLFPELASDLSPSDDDEEQIYDGEPSRPSKRKVEDEDYEIEEDDESPRAKRNRSRKAVKPAPVPKMRRDSRDDITSRQIASLRASNSDSPDIKRRIHNVLERKRRNDLKTNYQELRECIPELETLDRAPTGQILQKAVEFIAELQAQEQQLLAEITAARQENERLRRLQAAL